MASEVDQWIQEATLRPEGYEAGARRIVTAAERVEAAHKRMAASVARFYAQNGGAGYGIPWQAANKSGTEFEPPYVPGWRGSGGGGGGGGYKKGFFNADDFMQGLMQAAQVAFNAIKIVTEVTTGLASAMTYASRQAAQYDMLVKSLEALEGGAKGAADELVALKEIAKAPGVGFGEAVQGYILLRNSGLNSQFSERLMEAFAQANARAGGGKDIFGQIMFALARSATKPFLQGYDLRQLAMARVPVYKILEDQYGTSDTRELKRRGIGSLQALEGIVKVLEKMPHVAGGAQNAWDNFMDALHYSIVDIGKGYNESGFAQFLQDTADVLNSSQKGGLWRSLGEGIFGNFTSIVDAMTAGLGGSSAENFLGYIYAGIMTLGDGIQNMYLTLCDILDTLRLMSPLTWFTAKESTDGFNMEDMFQKHLAEALGPGLTGNKEGYIGLGKIKEQKIRGLYGMSSWMRQSLLGDAGTGPGGRDEAADDIEEIKDNTAETAHLLKKQFDRSQGMIGGGHIGGFGFTSIELSQWSGANRPKQRLIHHISSFVNELLGLYGLENARSELYMARSADGN